MAISKLQAASTAPTLLSSGTQTATINTEHTLLSSTTVARFVFSVDVATMVAVCVPELSKVGAVDATCTLEIAIT